MDNWYGVDWCNTATTSWTSITYTNSTACNTADMWTWGVGTTQEPDVAPEAEKRAEELLDAALTKRQRRQLRTHRYFTVESKTSKRRYRIHAGKGRHGNIEEVDEAGRSVRQLCCAPTGKIPEADALLGQKLYLEHAEEEFRRTANITELRRTA